MSILGNSMEQTAPITRRILWLNIAVFLLDWMAGRSGLDLSGWFGLASWNNGFFAGAYTFHIWQPVTYMFMHANFNHLFCNMLAVYCFGPVLEQRWGARKYTIYYAVSGVGAALVQELVWMLLQTQGITVGASGAVFGLLFAFGWLFPDAKIFLYFLIPVPARLLVFLYALFELWAGVSGAGDGVAHFAHLGGLLFGLLLILYWKKTGREGFEYNEYHSPWWKRFKQWFSDRTRSFRKHEGKSFQTTYHYQAPVNNQASSEPEKKADERDEEVNRLLEKIKRDGYSSLTQEEKDRLFKH